MGERPREAEAPAGNVGGRRNVEWVPVVGDAVRSVRILRAEGWNGLRARISAKIRRQVRRVSGRSRLRSLLKRLREAPEEVVVLASTVDWNIPLFQRPQQLANAIAKSGRLALYVTPNARDEVSGFEQVAERCYLVDRLEPCLAAFERLTLIVPSPGPAGFPWRALGRVRRQVRLIYDYVDALHPDVAEVTGEVIRRHAELLRTADRVAVTSRALLADAERTRPGACVLCPNAADVEHFRLRETPPMPEAMRRALGEPATFGTTPSDASSRAPVVGYSGALARWIDYALLERIAKHHPEWRIVLVGWDYDGSLGASGILDLPTVHYLGTKPYAELPRYIAHFDAAILPFLSNEVTIAASPIKVFEYMAARKPVVSTDLPECRGYASIAIGASHDEFIARLEQALAHRLDAAVLSSLDREADENTWARRARMLLD